MLGNNILARAIDCPTQYRKPRNTRKGGNPDKGIMGRKPKDSKVIVRKARNK